MTISRQGNMSAIAAGNGLTAQAASRFITTLTPENAVSTIHLLPSIPLGFFFLTCWCLGCAWAFFFPTAYPCPYPGCLRAFNVSSNMRRDHKNHDFLANNRPKHQKRTFKTSLYSPPLQPDVYPPPPLQWGFRHVIASGLNGSVLNIHNAFTSLGL